MERCILKHTYNYFNSNILLTPLQSGFTPGDPTSCTLIDLYNTFCSALDDGKQIRVIFCDISKALDRVWHTGLIHTLNKYGVSGKVLLWFIHYLSERKQRVVVHGNKLNGNPCEQACLKDPFSDRSCSLFTYTTSCVTSTRQFDSLPLHIRG
jgi:hypothetical protein